MLNFQIHLKLKQVIKIEECHERSIMACLKLLLNEKLGLSALYPNNSIHFPSQLRWRWDKNYRPPQNKNLYKLSVVKGNPLQQLQQHQLWQ
jgi:hypothetical protein